MAENPSEPDNGLDPSIPKYVPSAETPTEATTTAMGQT